MLFTKYPILAYVSVITAIIPIFICVMRWESASREMKILWLLIVIGFITDLVSFSGFVKFRFIPYLIHSYVLLEFVLIIVIIASWQTSRKVALFFKVIVVVYIIFWIIAKLYFEPIRRLYYLTGSISHVIITLTAGYSLFLVFEQSSWKFIRDFRFWTLTAFVLMYAGSLLPISLGEILDGYSEQVLNLGWSLNWVFSIISYILYSIGFLCHRTPT